MVEFQNLRSKLLELNIGDSLQESLYRKAYDALTQFESLILNNGAAPIGNHFRVGIQYEGEDENPTPIGIDIFVNPEEREYWLLNISLDLDHKYATYSYQRSGGGMNSLELHDCFFIVQ